MKINVTFLDLRGLHIRNFAEKLHFEDFVMLEKPLHKSLFSIKASCQQLG